VSRQRRHVAVASVTRREHAGQVAATSLFADDKYANAPAIMGSRQ
jgi:hypothetical protein